MFYKFDELFHRFNYPTGEVHVELKDEEFLYNDDLIIESHCRTAEDLFAVAMASNILRSEAKFLIPYLPFARHDHMRDNLDGFPLATVASLLEDVNVVTVDPHSDVTANMYSHVRQSDVVNFFRDRVEDTFNPIFLIPDAGATKKAYTWLREDDFRIQGFKKRDRATGKLSGFGFVREDVPEDMSSYNLVIVDDICDGGGTFIGLINALTDGMPYAWRPKRTELWVTHGMFQNERWHDLTIYFNRIMSFDNGKNHYLARQPPFSLFEFKEIFNAD